MYINATGKLRLIRSYNDMLQTSITKEKHTMWDLYLQIQELVLPAASSRENPFSPYFLEHAREMRTFCHCLKGLQESTSEARPIHQYVQDLQQRLHVNYHRNTTFRIKLWIKLKLKLATMPKPTLTTTR